VLAPASLLTASPLELEPSLAWASVRAHAISVSAQELTLEQMADCPSHLHSLDFVQASVQIPHKHDRPSEQSSSTTQPLSQLVLVSVAASVLPQPTSQDMESASNSGRARLRIRRVMID
jgi:hypothetical protein